MAQLAATAGVSVSTVKRIEDPSYGLVAEPTWLVVQQTLESAGVTFLVEDAEGPGIRVSRGACGLSTKP